MTRARMLAVVAVAAAAALTAGCAPTVEPMPVPPSSSTPTPSANTDPLTLGPVQPTGVTTVIASGLQAPWSIVRLDDAVLVSERDTAQVKELAPDGSARVIAGIPDVVPGGEGGLLGIEVLEQGSARWLYVYVTALSDNRIMRFPLTGEAGSYALGSGEPVLSGLAKAGNHNGGRIKFGPDGMLYATVGDAGRAALAQDLSSYNGKILRMTPEGAVPPDNPFAGSHVWSLGHRNPQGIAWDRDGRLWSSEFGQNTWDELNLITAGANYGWPVVEGAAGDPAYSDPVYQWPTSEASPSGLAFTRDTLFLAALRGARLWAVYPGDPTVATEWFTNELGRLRDAIPGPDGTLWILTNNTDGRGSPAEGDDRILQVELTPTG